MAAVGSTADGPARAAAAAAAAGFRAARGRSGSDGRAVRQHRLGWVLGCGRQTVSLWLARRRCGPGWGNDALRIAGAQYPHIRVATPAGLGLSGE